MKILNKTQAHDLLMQHKNHYLWHKHYHKWTEQYEQNLINGVNTHGERKPKGNKVSEQPVEMTTPEGTVKQYRSVAEASRKTGINLSSIYAVVNGRFETVKNNKFKRIVTN